MKLAIVGSRSFYDYKRLKSFIMEQYDVGKITDIISGGAQGTDRLAEMFAEELGINMIIHYPQWSLYGKQAGYIRNIKIIRECDECVAFWDGQSKGTLIDIDLCKRYNKPCCKYML